MLLQMTPFLVLCSHVMDASVFAFIGASYRFCTSAELRIIWSLIPKLIHQVYTE